uniref:Uncharacterized protein n=1 Tax=viral metagenome TaxID=1070528 RepID=A0A6M3IIW7_9ZZZZ
MFEYIQEQYSLISGDLLEGSLTINATVYIKAEDVKTESTYRGISAQLDGKRTSIVKKNYPLDLQRFYRIKVYLSEKTMTKNVAGQMDSSFGAQFEPFDLWISCMLRDVSVRSNNNIFDFASYVELMNNRFEVKGLVPEFFGTHPILHVFLAKETSTE